MSPAPHYDDQSSISPLHAPVPRLVPCFLLLCCTVACERKVRLASHAASPRRPSVVRRPPPHTVVGRWCSLNWQVQELGIRSLRGMSLFGESVVRFGGETKLKPVPVRLGSAGGSVAM
nr:unnamed protein product [Digitaria exilis]